MGIWVRRETREKKSDAGMEFMHRSVDPMHAHTNTTRVQEFSGVSSIISFRWGTVPTKIDKNTKMQLLWTTTVSVFHIFPPELSISMINSRHELHFHLKVHSQPQQFHSICTHSCRQRSRDKIQYLRRLRLCSRSPINEYSSVCKYTYSGRTVYTRCSVWKRDEYMKRKKKPY